MESRVVLNAPGRPSPGLQSGATPMGRCGWVFLAVAVGGGGCLPRHPAESPPTRTARAVTPLTPAAAADALLVRSVLLEQPTGDPFLDRDLWAAGRPAGPARVTAILAENGLRAVVLGGQPPSRFLELIGSDAATVSPQVMTFAQRKEAVVPTNGPVEAATFDVLPDLGGTRSPVSLHAAAFGWRVRPEALAGGRVRLELEPQVQHGGRREFLRPNGDGTGFTAASEVPVERYPSLGFEVTVDGGDYLVIGGRADAANSLGQAFFRVEADGRVRQRVLVVRAGRAGPPAADDLPPVPRPRGALSPAAAAGLGRG